MSEVELADFDSSFARGLDFLSVWCRAEGDLLVVEEEDEGGDLLGFWGEKKDGFRVTMFFIQVCSASGFHFVCHFSNPLFTNCDLRGKSLITQ
ncbi:MAG: hypothetical protein E4G98_03560 [Promethearchaeota archaeon]|nr:MAG: hypothetical protein E4G98_03560 [Candidatus Lokiarchaeota archaeon]